MKIFLASLVLSIVLMPYGARAQTMDIGNMMEMYTSMTGIDINQMFGGSILSGTEEDSSDDSSDVYGTTSTYGDDYYGTDDAQTNVQPMQKQGNGDGEGQGLKQGQGDLGSKNAQAQVVEEKVILDAKTQERLDRVTESMRKKQRSLINAEGKLNAIIESMRKQGAAMSMADVSFKVYQEEGIALLQEYKAYQAFLKTQVNPEFFDIAEAEKHTILIHERQQKVRSAYDDVRSDIASIL